jgi:hypothetical protein
MSSYTFKTSSIQNQPNSKKHFLVIPVLFFCDLWKFDMINDLIKGIKPKKEKKKTHKQTNFTIYFYIFLYAPRIKTS